MFEGIFNSNNILSINFALKQAKHNNLTTKQAALHRCQNNILKELQIKKKRIAPSSFWGNAYYKNEFNMKRKLTFKKILKTLLC